MENLKVIEEPHFTIDEKEMEKQFAPRAGKPNPGLRRAKEMLGELLSVACPKAIYGTSKIIHISREEVSVGGRIFSSASVAKNLENSDFVVPYIITAGVEANSYVEKCGSDFLDQFYAIMLDLIVLSSFAAKVNESIKQEYFPDSVMSNMSPGFFPDDWGRKPLHDIFALFGDAASFTGCRVTESDMLFPSKSVCGFYFASDVNPIIK